MAKSSRIVGSSSVGRKDVLDVLTEDIQSHREYIQKLYRTAAVVGGTGILLAVAVGTWFLGRELNAAILQYSIDQQLIAKMDELLENRSEEEVAKISVATEEATQSALEKINSATTDAGRIAQTEIGATSANQIALAKQELDQYLSDQLTDEVRESVQPLLAEFSQASVEEVAQRLAIPAGFVAAFDRPSGCPSGWTDMGAEWRGRMIVAAVRDANDQYGFGRIGGAETHTLTLVEIPPHNHNQGGFDRLLSVDGGVTVISADNAAPNTEPNIGRNGNAPIVPQGGGQPHNNMPPYIALYLCKKN